MIRKIAYPVLFSLLFFVVVSFLLSGEVEVERSLDVQRPVVTLYTVLNRPVDYPNWITGQGPEARTTFRAIGPVSGSGAGIEWSGDPRQWGTGSMEITASRPGALIRSQVKIQGQGEAEFDLQLRRIAGGSRLVWTVRSDLSRDRGVFGSLVARYFGLLFDRWAGARMEESLARFRDYANRLPATDFSGLEVEQIVVAPLDILYVYDAAGDHENSPGLAGAFREISSFMAANHIELAAQPMTVAYEGKNGQTRLHAAIPVQRVDIPASGNLSWGQSPSGEALRAVHHGPYENLSLTRAKLLAWMAAHGYRASAVSWEHYLSDPGVTPTDEQIAHVYIRLAQ